MNVFEDAGKFGKEAVDNGLKSLAAVTKGFQSIASATADYSKVNFEKSAAAAEQLAASKSLEKAIEVQSTYAKDAYEAFVVQATKLGELYADVAKEAYKPFETALAKAK